MASHTHMLGIETSGKVGGVALGRDGALVDEIPFEKGLIHGRALVPTIMELLAKHSLAPAEIGVVAVSIGPGSFTGVRVGVACAKMLAFATGAALVAVASPDVIVQNAPAGHEHAVAAGDARRGSIFACLYRRVKDEWQRETDILALTPEELLAMTPKGALVLGDAIPKYREAFIGAGLVLAEEPLWCGRASAVLQLAWPRFRQGLTEDVARLVPTYLRPTEAEINLMQKRMREKHDPHGD